MGKLLIYIKRNLVFFLLVANTLALTAQKEQVNAAARYLQQKSLDSAKIAIEKAILDNKTSTQGNTWYLRGFIYKSIYNTQEKEQKYSSARIQALESFKHAYEIDTSKQAIQESIKNIKYLATTLYNDAAASLDSMDYKTALEVFDTFKKYYSLVDTSAVNNKQTDIKFLQALASVYTQLFDLDKKVNVEFLSRAKNTYNKVLTMDPNNIFANYNMGILYYNQAVNLINQLDYGTDIRSLSDVQDNSIKLFKESLPFLEKAYALDPKRKETLYGLSGIYYSLNEMDKSNLFKQRLEEMKEK
ncbi:MAG: hypothetical protein ABI315_08790 [Bacteroidia bacterium]